MADLRLVRRNGRERGRATASWVFDGRTDDATYRWALRGIEAGDPEVLDRLAPPAWLSGEWAGDFSGGDATALGWTDEHMNAYVEAADSAFWREIGRVARFHTQKEG